MSVVWRVGQKVGVSAVRRVVQWVVLMADLLVGTWVVWKVVRRVGAMAVLWVV